MNAITPNQRTVFERLVQALNEGGRTHEVSDVMRALQHGDAQVWCGERDSVAITQVMRYPAKYVLRYWLAAGDLEDLRPLLPKLEEWGRERGATMAEAIGRLGWAREARRAGYTLDAAVYRKEL